MIFQHELSLGSTATTTQQLTSVFPDVHINELNQASKQACH